MKEPTKKCGMVRMCRKGGVEMVKGKVGTLGETDLAQHHTDYLCFLLQVMGARKKSINIYIIF